MALRMKIVSDNAATAGKYRRWTFGVNGGRIGRHDSNDWVLRDPERYVSGRHAEIEHQGGLWWLRDLSTNGTYVNDSMQALGPDQAHQLSNGDRIRIGEYEIEVEISGGNDFMVNEALPVTEPDLDASFDVKSVLAKDSGEPESRARQAPAQDHGRRPRQRQPSPPASPAPAASARARDEQKIWPGIVALCKGAGIDPHSLSPEVRSSALHHAGQLLRETLVGFSELARTRADFASEFGISSGSRRRDATNPMVQVAGVEQLLEMLLAGRGPGDAASIEEIRSQFGRARHHEIAVAAALREALATVLEKLDPDELEEQLGRHAKDAATAEVQVRLWNRYRELFRATVQTGDAGLPAVFLVAFARAYESFVFGGEAGDRQDDRQDD